MVFDLLESVAPDEPVDTGIDEAIPPLILDSPILADLHRRELAFLMALEEGTLKVASQLIRGAAAGESLYFAARQTFDDVRHLEAFCRRLDATLAAGRSELAPDAVIPRPLRAYLDRCLAFANEPATHLETLTLLNLGFKSMAAAFYTFAARYWHWVDPLLSEWLQEVASEEAVHVRRAAQLGGAAPRIRVRRGCATWRPRQPPRFTTPFGPRSAASCLRSAPGAAAAPSLRQRRIRPWPTPPPRPRGRADRLHSRPLRRGAVGYAGAGRSSAAKGPRHALRANLRRPRQFHHANR